MSESADFQKGLTAYESGDYATALHEWTPLAVKGDADSQFNLGLMYKHGRGVRTSLSTAVKWFRLSAEQGHANAQYNLGFMYDNGQGILQDYVRAHMWLNIDATTGNKHTETSLRNG